ncbi:hypothetical protein [Streptomyces pseudogriseolus]
MSGPAPDPRLRSLIDNLLLTWGWIDHPSEVVALARGSRARC